MAHRNLRLCPGEFAPTARDAGGGRPLMSSPAATASTIGYVVMGYGLGRGRQAGNRLTIIMSTRLHPPPDREHDPDRTDELPALDVKPFEGPRPPAPEE